MPQSDLSNLPLIGSTNWFDIPNKTNQMPLEHNQEMNTVMILSFRTDGWANSVDPDQNAPTTSDQGLHCLLFCFYLLDALLYSKTTLFKV